MSLETYWEKRNFHETPEPRGGRKASKYGRSFVIQKHDASHLHYDFRLEIDGVLKSWAIPKGPSLDPKVKRLAVEVEDHPLEYAKFEGEIPAGEYGGGEVIIWDRGTWEPAGDPRKSLAKGRLEFEMKGVKLRGSFTLIRTRSNGSRAQWLLIKRTDDCAVPESEFDITSETKSVLSERFLSRDADEGGKPGELRAAERNRRRGPVLKTGSRKGGKRTSIEKSSGRRPGASGSDSLEKFTHPEKLLYPDLDVTKDGFRKYLKAVKKHLLPHLVHRPIALLRCPKGVMGKCFFQKNLRHAAPDALKTQEIRDVRGKPAKVICIEDEKGLDALAQLGALEVHVWGASADDVRSPDRIIFDLDPAEDVEWKQVARAALRIRDLLDQLGMKSFLKTSGGKGYHVHVPVKRGYSWDEIKAFSTAVAERLVEEEPESYLAKMAKTKRHGKIFIDIFRNGFGATSIAPYYPRARREGTVAIPIEWKDALKIRPDHFTMKNVLSHLRQRKTDPWKGYFKAFQGIQILEEAKSQDSSTKKVRSSVKKA